MSTGAIINHGVSGFACTGIAGDYQDQPRGTPWELSNNDPTVSYNNSQNHLGLFLNAFEAPWEAGPLQAPNMSAQPYRQPIVGPIDAPPPPTIQKTKIAPITYPDLTLDTHPQQLPFARIHVDRVPPPTYRQNIGFESGTSQGPINPVFPGGVIPVLPNTVQAQGSQTPAGTHPGADNAGQQTTGNTSKPDQAIGQTPSQKLPNGVAVGSLMDQEPPPLWAQAPPPTPPILPGEGTQPLRSTNPPWW